MLIIAPKVKVMISLWPQIPGFPGIFNISLEYIPGFDFWFWILTALWPEAIYLMTVSTISLICKTGIIHAFLLLFQYTITISFFTLWELKFSSYMRAMCIAINLTFLLSFLIGNCFYCFSDIIVSIYYSKFSP